MSFNIKRVKYDVLIDNDFDLLNEFFNYEYRIDELRYTITHAIGIMGLFRTKLGKKTCDKIMKRIKEEWCPLKNE